MHIPPVHLTPLAVQICWPPPPKPPPSGPPAASVGWGSVPQQTWEAAPQGAPAAVWHDPAVQVPETPSPEQASPAPTQTRLVPPKPASVAWTTQHPVPLHELPAQQD
jgi:hypothetical protein